MKGDNPSWLEIEASENRAFMALRSAESIGTDWGRLIADAQYVMGRARKPINGGYDHLLEFGASKDLIAASRILDNAAQAFRAKKDVPDYRRVNSDSPQALEDGHPEDIEPSNSEKAFALELLAAVAYGMHGNFCSARAVINRHCPNFETLSVVRSTIIALCAPDLIGFALAGVRANVRREGELANLAQVAPWMDLSDKMEPNRRLYMTLIEAQGSPAVKALEFLQEFEGFLQRGNDAIFDALREKLRLCFSSDWNPFDMALWGAARICFSHALKLSVARGLTYEGSPFPTRYVANLTRLGKRVFFPPQFRALAAGTITDRHRNCLINLPTSAGKTLLAELALVASLCSEEDAANQAGLACYVVPYIALGTQVARVLNEHLAGTDIKVHRLFGDHPWPGLDIEEPTKAIIVATPERLDSALRTRTELLSRLRCVVCDEAHMIENGTRGVRLEGLITRLRIQQTLAPAEAGRVRLILVSAVLKGHDEVTDWLGGSEQVRLLIDEWKPTAKRFALWKQDGKLTWYVGQERVGGRGFPSETQIGFTRLLWPQKDFRPTRFPAQSKKHMLRAFENIAYLVEYLYEAFPGEPILCVCATKASTRALAKALATRLPELSLIGDRIGRTVQTIESEHSYLRSLAHYLRHGVAFHNASVPHQLRELIEAAILAGEIQAVVSTTTLAEGVDLPFRITVLVDWIHYRNKAMSPMSPTLFRNISGRCGRAGTYTEGDTIAFDNPIGEAAIANPYYRELAQREIFFSDGESQPLGSAFFQASKPFADVELRSGLEAQFMAAIEENPHLENLEQVFASHSYATRATKDGDLLLTNQFQQIANSLTLAADGVGAFASRNSPLRLTPLGKAANMTSFSPASCRLMIAYLSTLSGRDTFDADFLAGLLVKFGTLPEQPDEKFKAAVIDPVARKASLYCVRIAYLEQILVGWLAGDRLELIFSQLPNIRSSTRDAKVDQWLRGEVESQSWDDAFDKFVNFIHCVLRGYLPWLIRACGTLSAHLGGNAAEVPWSDLALLIEHPRQRQGQFVLEGR